MEVGILVLSVAAVFWMVFSRNDRTAMTGNVAQTVVTTTGIVNDTADFARMGLSHAKLDAIAAHAESQQERIQNGLSVANIKAVMDFDAQLLELVDRKPKASVTKTARK